ncbi:hypothetical protein MP638_000451, partial [Amoeboaphelidium occidentale]
MGVQGAHKFFKAKKLFSKHISYENYPFRNEHHYLDFEAVFYPLMCSKYSRSKDWDHMVKRITAIIPKSKHLTIVFDGGSTEEKQVTHIKRLETKRQSVQALQFFVDSLCKDIGCQEGAEDKVSLKRVSKEKKVLMKKFIKKAFVLTKQDKEEIMALLKRLGYQIEQAAGKADVFIGTKQGRVNVISPDSDMVFHLNDGIWAVPSLQGNNLMIRYIDVAEARNKLKLNLASLRALAVLSGNDYCSNVRGWAIASVYKWIRQYRKADLESCSKLVQSFLETVGSDSNFDKAIMIFECKEEHVLPHDDRTEKLLQLFLSNKESIKTWDNYNIAWKDKQENYIGKSDNLDLKRWIHKNPFRVLGEKFDDDNENLTRYKYKAVDTKSLCVFEVPPLPPKKRPKQPEEILKPQIEALQEHLDGSENNEESGSTASTSVHNSNKKRKKKSAKHQPSSRNFRNKPDAAEAGASGSRNVTDQSREMSSLKAKFVTKTWSIGALSTRIRQGQYAQYEKEILHCFSILVAQLNILKRKAQLAAEVFVESIIKLNENTLKLDDMILGDTKGQGGRKFWQPCMSF